MEQRPIARVTIEVGPTSGKEVRKAVQRIIVGGRTCLKDGCLPSELGYDEEFFYDDAPQVRVGQSGSTQNARRDYQLVVAGPDGERLSVDESVYSLVVQSYDWSRVDRSVRSQDGNVTHIAAVRQFAKALKQELASPSEPRVAEESAAVAVDA